MTRTIFLWLNVAVKLSTLLSLRGQLLIEENDHAEHFRPA